MIAAIGLLIGLLAGLLLQPDVPIWLEPYLPIAVVAALDAVFGALRAFLDGIFDDKVFVVSFVSNVLIAALIVYLGDKLGVGGQLSTGVIVVLGIRIFSNVAAIRRHIFHAGGPVDERPDDERPDTEIERHRARARRPQPAAGRPTVHRRAGSGHGRRPARGAGLRGIDAGTRERP